MEPTYPWRDELPEWAVDRHKRPSAEEIEFIKQMTPAERLRLGMRFTQLGWERLLKLPPEERQRILDEEREPWNWPSRPGEGTSA